VPETFVPRQFAIAAVRSKAVEGCLRGRPESRALRRFVNL